MIIVEMDTMQAIAVRTALYAETKMYTYDPTCIPPRVVDIRKVIVDLDQKIESALNTEKLLAEAEAKKSE